MSVLISKAAVVKATNPTITPILEVAARLEGKIRQAYVNAVLAIQTQVVLIRLEAAIQSGDVERVMSMLDISHALQGIGLAAGVVTFREALQATFFAGAQAALKELPPAIGLSAAFDLLNPEAVKFLNGYSFNLIQQISQDTRAAIQQILLRAFQEGASPYEQAREIREIIGLTARMEQAIANYRAALESGNMRDALARALRDGRFDRTLLRSLNEGKGLSQAQIDRMVDRYRERMLQYRARNLARTESIRASAAGQRSLWAQARQQGLLPAGVRRVWIASGDDRECPECADLDGQTAGLDEPFEDGTMDPPQHPSCRCSLAIDVNSMRRVA